MGALLLLLLLPLLPVPRMVAAAPAEEEEEEEPGREEGSKARTGWRRVVVRSRSSNVCPGSFFRRWRVMVPWSCGRKEGGREGRSDAMRGQGREGGDEWRTGGFLQLPWTMKASS